MNNECMGIINLERSRKFSTKLTSNRPIAAMPFGGRYRVIDFALSNLVNAGISNIGLFTDEHYRSLMGHLGSGKYWDLNRNREGLFVFTPEDHDQQAKDRMSEGDIITIYNHRDYITKSRQKYVLIIPDHMICNIDYKEVVTAHKKSKADMTIVYKTIEQGESDFLNCHTLTLDRQQKIKSVGKNIGYQKRCHISMNMYVMKKTLFLDLIYKAVENGRYYWLNDLLLDQVHQLNVKGYSFSGYLKSLHSIESYVEANYDLLNTDVANELFYSNRKILTKIKGEPPSLYTEDSKVEHSLISNGCIIEGTVKNSILFGRVKVEQGAVIENSIIMANCIIKKNVRLNNVIFDKNVIISNDKQLMGNQKVPMIVYKNMYI